MKGGHFFFAREMGMKKRFLLCVVSVAVVCTLCACGKKQDAEKQDVEKQEAPQAQTGPQPAPQPAQDPGAMVASVDGSVITAGEVDQEMKGLLARFGGRVPPEQLKELEPKMRDQATENLVTKRLIIAEAGRRTIKPTQEEIAAELKTISDQFPSPEEFQKQLKEMGVSSEKLNRDIDDHLKVKAVYEQAIASVPPVTDEDINKFYSENAETFKVPEQVRASHILLKVEKDASDETRAMKKKEIDDLRAQIAGGADFGKLAAQHSDCPSKEREGDLGLFARGRMVKEFEDAAFKLAPGEISEVVQTPFGYHIIKVTERKDARTLSLDEVREEIREHLKSRRQEEAFEAFLQKLREGAQIEYARK